MGQAITAQPVLLRTADAVPHALGPRHRDRHLRAYCMKRTPQLKSQEGLPRRICLLHLPLGRATNHVAVVRLRAIALSRATILTIAALKRCAVPKVGCN